MIHELMHIVADPAHWVGEAVMDTTFALPFYVIGRWRLKVHDRRKHGEETR
jgi:hypothetical protein